MNQKNIIIFGSYIGVLVLITIAVKLFGVISSKAGLWIALIVAAGYAAMWPRWGREG